MTQTPRLRKGETWTFPRSAGRWGSGGTRACVLAILAGFTRYCHVERLRNDAACAALLGLTKVVSDEYKNQWGWCGFVTQKLKPTRAMARLIAIVANWWNVFCRLAEGGRHMEAITSRPMLMGIVGRIVTSGRKRCMHLTSTHAEAPEIRESLERIGAFLGAVSATAPQLGFDRTWALILRVAFRKWLGGKPLDPLFDGDQMLLRQSG